MPELGRLCFPFLRNAPLLDRLLTLLLGVALLGRGDERGVDDLPAHGDVAGLAQRRVEPVEQRLDRLGPGQLLPRNSQIVRASGSRSDWLNPRNRMNDRRSLIRNSVRSSERVLAASITQIVRNVLTGSNGGRPPCEPSE